MNSRSSVLSAFLTKLTLLFYEIMKITARYCVLTFLLIILFGGNVISQSYHPDTLRSHIAKETNDTVRINLMIRYLFRYSTVRDLRMWLNEIVELSRKNNYRPGLIYLNYADGLTLSNIGKYDEAIDITKSVIDALDSLGTIQPAEYPLSKIRTRFDFAGKQEDKFRYYTDKLVYYEKYGPVENTSNCLFGIAGYYLYIADYDKSIEYYLRALEVYETFDSLGCAIVLGGIGNAYLQWGNLEKAEVYLKAGLNKSIRFYSRQYITFCYISLSDLYFIKGDYEKALKCCFDLKNLYPDNSPEYRAINLVQISAIYLPMKVPDSAEFYLNAAEKIRQTNPVVLVAPYGNLEIDYTFYMYYLAMGCKKDAQKRLEKALQDAQSCKYLPLVLKYTNELHLFLLNQGDSLQSLRYLVQYQSLQDSLNSMNTRARIASYEIEQQQLQQETEIENLQTQKATQRNYYLIGGVFLVLIALGAFSRFRYKRKRDEELLTTNFKKQLAQAETKALRSQMNPHFIFNSLNSINSFVMDQQHEIASEYLIKFSKLIRLILDNSRSETITIEKELETLKLYVTLESARFDNKFRCIFDVAENVNTNSIMIPPMLLQPFVENAIWHGLMQKDGEGTITIGIKMDGEEAINISITDDGIGREKAAELKSKSATHKSHGLKVTSQRIEMMNKLNSTGAQVNIFDLRDESGKATGTRVELVIPV